MKGTLWRNATGKLLDADQIHNLYNDNYKVPDLTISLTSEWEKGCEYTWRLTARPFGHKC